MALYILIAIPVVLLLVWMALYNGLVVRRNGVENAFASLDATLQKRYDLIPNLVETVKGYATHERETLEKLAQLRGAALQSGASDLRAHEKVGVALRGVLALSESYPQLQASANFLHLQKSLNEVEEQISASRRAFNAAVTEYNNAVQSFPSSVVASSMGLQTRSWFESGDDAQNPVAIGGAF